MGISSFVSQFVQAAAREFPGIFPSRLPQYVESLSLDLNSLLHQAAQKFFAYGEGDPDALAKRRELLFKMRPEERITGYGRTLMTELTTVLYNFRPAQLLMLAVDGVAPISKINQQRSRRLVASIENSALVEPSGYFFDSSNITPGTDFMFEVDKFIKDWTVDQLDPTYIIYSSFLTPGEGEHKIFNEMRKGAYKEGPHIIYGLDADLVILSLLATYPDGKPVQNIYLVRDTQIVSINDLRDYILSKVGSVGDFALMSFLAGNDFLPDQPMVSDIGKFLIDSLGIVQTLKLKLTDIATINWKDVSIFLTELAKKEKQDLLVHAENVKEKNDKLPKDQKEDSPFTRALTQTNGPSSLPNASRQLTKHPQRYNTKPTYTLNYTLFRRDWYLRSLAPVQGYDAFYINLIGGPKTNIDQPKIDGMISNYIQGLAWIYEYYRTGSPSGKAWLYQYLYTPLVSDLATWDIAGYWEKGGIVWTTPGNRNVVEPINPVYQLLAVMPPKAAMAALPEALREFFTPESRIWDYYPATVLVDRVENRSNHGVTVHVPPIDIGRIIQVVNDAGLVLSRYDPIDGFMLERNENTAASQRENKRPPPTVVSNPHRGRGNERGGYRGNERGNERGGRGGYHGGRGGRGGNYNAPIQSFELEYKPRGESRGRSTESRGRGYEQRGQYKPRGGRGNESSGGQQHESATRGGRGRGGLI